MKYEVFCDICYYHMWCVRPVGEKRWGYCYHLPSKEEAEGLAKELDELRTEVAELRAWKESALALEREWDQQALAKLLGGKLGESCRKIIAERVPPLVADNAALRAEVAELKRLPDYVKLQQQLDAARAAMGKEAKP